MLVFEGDLELVNGSTKTEKGLKQPVIKSEIVFGDVRKIEASETQPSITLTCVEAA